jgi:hypothetical protein
VTVWIGNNLGASAVKIHTTMRVPILNERSLGTNASIRPPSAIKRDAAVWPDGVFAQMRPGTARPVQNDEHLAALGCDLHAESGISGVPVDDSAEGVGSASMALLVNLIRGMGRHLSEGAILISHR